MNGYIVNIEKETLGNENFRKVLFTTERSQLVVMAVQTGDDIGMEVHEEHDQFIRIERGKARVILNGEEIEVEDDFAIVIPAGTEHNIINTGEEVLKLYTIYTPPEHAPETIHETKAEAKEHHH
ncbi:MAG: cupin domain-containing protein [Candidatus Magasanikbacteria bacterium]